MSRLSPISKNVAEKIMRVLKGERKTLGWSKETKQWAREKVQRKVHFEQGKLLQSRTLRETCRCRHRIRPYFWPGKTPRDFVRIYRCLSLPALPRKNYVWRIGYRGGMWNEFPVRGTANYPFHFNVCITVHTYDLALRAGKTFFPSILESDAIALLVVFVC